MVERNEPRVVGRPSRPAGVADVVNVAAVAAARIAVEPLESRTMMSVAPNDPGYAQQWSLKQVSAAAAWDRGTGKATVLVGHADTGVDYTHPDLYKNIWINQAEIPAALRGKLADADRDGRISFWDLNAAANKGKVADVNRNGRIDGGDLLARWRADRTGGWADGINGKNNANDRYVDDIVGWDFGNNDNNPMDAEGHGTHTAGVLAAEGNNRRGGAGVVWKTSLVALKLFGDGTAAAGADTNAIAAAIRYAADVGARVTNNSYGSAGGTVGDPIYKAIQYANTKGMLMVFAAGNDAVDNDRSWLASYPASHKLPNIVSVAATDTTRRLAYFTNYGRSTVHLAAPGSGVYSTWRGGTYRTVSGTSMAAPLVTGTIALMLSQNPTLTAPQLKARLLAAADQSAGVLGTSTTGGVLNVSRAVQGLAGTRVIAR
jgi:subtilisin family serine protease